MRRVLVDECINPRLAERLRFVLPQYTITTVRDLGKAGHKDYRLIPQIQGRFDVFLTLDKGFEFEHNLKKLSFGVVILTAANNQMQSYERLLSDLVRRIQDVVPAHVAHVADPEC